MALSKKLYEFLGNRGSLKDGVSGVFGSASNVSFVQDKMDCLKFASNGEVNGYGAISGVQTVVLFIRPSTNTKLLLDNGTDKLEITGGNVSGTGLTQCYVDNADTDTVNLNKWQCIIAEFSAGINFATDFEIDVTALTYIGLLVMYEGIATTTERAKLYQDFLRSSPIAYPIRNFDYPKPSDLSREDGLVADYEFEPVNGVLPDASGNGNDGTVNGALSTKDGMICNGVSNKLVLPNTLFSSNPFTILIRFNSLDGSNNVIYGEGYSSSVSPRFLLRSDTNKKLNLVAAATILNTLVSQATNRVVFDGLDHDIGISIDNGVTKIYIDGTEDENSISGLFNFTYSTTTLNKATLGALERTTFSLYCKAEFKNFKSYNKILSEAQIKSYHNSYARRKYLTEHFKYPVLETNIPNWNKGTGAYVIGELTANDSILTELKKGTKYLQCTSSGTIAIPSNKALGCTWEFLAYKGGDGNQISIHFISSGIGDYIYAITGYRFAIGSNESLNLLKINGSSSFTSLFITAASYIQNNTYYKIKVTRTTAGVFTVFIKGGLFGNTYQLVSTTGGSGTNPVTDTAYTTSNYIVADLDTGDRLALLDVYEGIEA